MSGIASHISRRALLHGLLHISAQLSAMTLATPAVATSTRHSPLTLHRSPPKVTALVIGISHYHQLQSLPSAIRDAQLIAGSMALLGFQTQFVLNATYQEMETALTEFQSRSSEADLVIIYIAAHGIQYGGNTHIFTADTDINKQYLGRSISEQTLVTALSDRPRQKVLFLDCCRNMPNLGAQATSDLFAKDRFYRNQISTSGQALAGLHVTYATQPGAPALDGDDGYSPFAGALHRALLHKGLGLDEMVRRIRLDVLQATQGIQVPWSRSSLLMPVILNP